MFFDELAESHYFLGECKGKLIIPAFLRKGKNCRNYLLADVLKTSIIFILRYPSCPCAIIVVRDENWLGIRNCDHLALQYHEIL